MLSTWLYSLTSISTIKWISWNYLITRLGMFRIPSQSGCGKKTFRNNSKNDCYILFIQLPNSISATPLDKKNRDYYLACFCPISRVKTSFGMTKTWQDSLFSVAWPWAMGLFQRDSIQSLSKNNKTLKCYYPQALGSLNAAEIIKSSSNQRQTSKESILWLDPLVCLCHHRSEFFQFFFCFVFSVCRRICFPDPI